MAELTDGGYEMLRAAVNMATKFRCKTVGALIRRLMAEYPGRKADIDCALKFWSAQL